MTKDGGRETPHQRNLPQKRVDQNRENRATLGAGRDTGHGNLRIDEFGVEVINGGERGGVIAQGDRDERVGDTGY